MADALARHLAYLERKLPRIAMLRRDLAAEEQRTRTYFVVDYSELHSYLHFAADATEFEVRYDSTEDRHVALMEFQLGLTHLFRSRANRVYLLPPHAREAWRHLEESSVTEEDVRRLESKVRTSINSLAPDQQQALESLSSGEAPSPAQREVLEELVANEFADLLSELDGVRVATASLRAATARLSPIKNKVVLSISPICSKEHVDHEKIVNVSREDIRRVFDCFGPVSPDATFAKFRDAEALLILRNLNRALKGKGARVLVVSRDRHIQRALEELSHQEWFGWSQGSGHLRTTQDLFLHLLAGGRSWKEAEHWIWEIESTIEDLRHLASSLRLAKRRLSRSQLRKNTETLLESARAHWRRYVNLRLASAVGEFSWLSDLSDAAQQPKDFEVPNTQASLRDLLRFVDSEDYRESIVEQVHATWAAFLSEGIWALFLQLFSKREAESLLDLVSEVHEDQRSKVVVTTSPVTAVGSLQFISERYRRGGAALQSQALDRRRRRRSKALLLRVIAEILGRGRNGGAYRPEAEDLLFIGFVLATMERWAEADRCAETAMQLPGDFHPHEALYLRAVCNRMRALTEGDARLLDTAFALIRKARQARESRETSSPRADNPRYLKEFGWIVLIGLSLAGESEDPDVGSSSGGLPRADLESAQAAIRDALSSVRNDEWLRAELCCLLAYSHAVGPGGDLAEAASALESLDRALQDQIVRSPSGLSWEVPMFLFMRLFVDARLAARGDDELGFRAALDKLEALAVREDLSEADRAFFSDRVCFVRALHRG